jgi:hypothetical protein
MKPSAAQKLLWIPPTLLAVVLCTGCSGINTTQSVSPATFLLPGLMKAEPAPAPVDPTLPVNPAAPTLAEAR